MNRLTSPYDFDLTREDMTDMDFHYFLIGLEELVNRKQPLTKSQTEKLADIVLTGRKLLEGIH